MKYMRFNPGLMKIAKLAGKAIQGACAILAVMLVLLMVSEGVKAQEYEFSTILVEGNQRIESATIKNYAGIYEGVTVSDGDINDAYQRVLQSGLFESVEIDPQGDVLTIAVVEFPTVNQIVFEGNQRINDSVFERIIESRPKQVFSPSKAERDADLIAEGYLRDGRVSARVTPKVIRRSDNRVDLVFEIFEGQAIEVKRIGFVGNRSFSDRRLRRVVESKQAGLLRFLTKLDTFVEDRLEFDRQVLTDFYASRGYVDFRVTGTNAELTRERDGYFITFNVEEGQQFRFGNIETVTDRTDLDADEFHQALKLKSGVVYSPTHVDRSIARMERLAIQKGIEFLRVEPQITRNERDLTLDVTFSLNRGPRIFVERIDIEGNTTTLDRVVRRQIDVVEGDPFNPRQIREAAERIRALGYFASSEVNTREGSRPDQVIVDVDVEETTTGTLSFGAGYSSDQGLGVTIGFSERNFLGRGQILSADIAASSDTTNYNINFVEPAFLGRDVIFGLATQLQETESANSAYDTSRGELRPSLGFPINDDSRVTVYYSVGYSEVTSYRGAGAGQTNLTKPNELMNSPGVGVPGTKVPGTEGYYCHKKNEDTDDIYVGSNAYICAYGPSVLQNDVDQGRLNKHALGLRYLRDTRRSGLNPNAGILLDAGIEIAGIASDQEYIQATGRLMGQTRVLGEDVLLRSSLEGGIINMLGGKRSRAIDRFTHQIIRGFDSNGIGPSQRGERVGGEKYAALKFETEFPIGVPDEFGVSGGAYYDVGSLWGLDKFGRPTDPNGPGIKSRDFKLRQVVGFALFWETPLGPLRMNFSHVLDKQPEDKTRSFDLSVRTDF